MKTINFTDFRKKASGFITEVEHGETIVIIRKGRPVAEIVPFAEKSFESASWKKPIVRLRMSGEGLSSAILEERESSL